MRSDLVKTVLFFLVGGILETERGGDVAGTERKEETKYDIMRQQSVVTNCCTLETNIPF